jgi:hypothetical protein
LSFAKERIGPLAAIVATIFYLLALYLFVLPNTPENPFASIYSETLIKTTSQHLLLLVGFDTLIYRKYYDTPPILVGHHPSVSKVVQQTTLLDRSSTNGTKICSSPLEKYWKPRFENRHPPTGNEEINKPHFHRFKR